MRFPLALTLAAGLGRLRRALSPHGARSRLALALDPGLARDLGQIEAERETQRRLVETLLRQLATLRTDLAAAGRASARAESRAPGFYWVRGRPGSGKRGGWEIARWNAGRWALFGVPQLHLDEDLEEIREEPLGREPPPAPQSAEA